MSGNQTTSQRQHRTHRRRILHLFVTVVLAANVVLVTPAAAVTNPIDASSSQSELASQSPKSDLVGQSFDGNPASQSPPAVVGTSTYAVNGTNQSFLCNVGIFHRSMNLLIQALVVGFSPIAMTAILGDRVIGALPLGKKRKKQFKQWRGGVLISAGVIYIGLPIAVAWARQAGFPLASCINFIPW